MNITEIDVDGVAGPVEVRWPSAEPGYGYDLRHPVLTGGGWKSVWVPVEAPHLEEAAIQAGYFFKTFPPRRR